MSEENSRRISDWDRMVAGKLYNPASKDVEEQHLQGLIRCDSFNRTPVAEFEKKQKALEELIPSAKGKSLGVFAPFYCEYGVNIHVGKDCFINYNCTFLDVSPITLGDSVWIGAGVILATPNHPFLASERLNDAYPDGYHDLEYSAPITIGDGCWICSGAVIGGGVTIGKGSIVAAGAVVLRDIPENCIVGGVPAAVIRKIDEKDRMDVWKTYQENAVPRSVRNREKLQREKSPS